MLYHSTLSPMRQEYEKYTVEDHQVWKILFERQIKNLPDVATAEYMRGIDKVGFVADRIPQFEEVNQRLIPLTNWQLHVVPGLIPNREFFELMSSRHFCATTWLRKMSQLDYLEEPDMFHDVFGHVPLLTNQPLCNFLEDLSRIALRFVENPHVIELISRIYWFTVEFGLIREEGQLKIYGAGILSSVGETKYCLSGSGDEIPVRVPYNVRQVLDTPYIKSKFQEKYFVIESYEQLFGSIQEIERLLEEESKI
ncbi:MAG: phenylalanine 4-monooxygenase [Bacteroidota bacterium]